MGDAETIKSFLVGLGFGVDDASLAKFNNSIATASLKVAALYAGIQVAAAGIFHSISGVSQSFEEMGYQLRIVAPAMNRWLVMRQAMLEAYSKAGVNLSDTVNQAIKFNYSLAKTKFALEALWKSVAAKFFPLLTKQMDIFRAKIYANMPKIQAQLHKFIEFIFKAFKATVQLGTTLYSILTRVWDFFARLDEATNGWSTIILGLVAAWQLFNLAFLATPLGMVLTGLLAILALYDDFKVWQEGGKSFFNWAPFLPVIEAVSAAMKAALDLGLGFIRMNWGLVNAFSRLFALDFSGFKNGLVKYFEDASASVSKLIDYLKALWGVEQAVVGFLPTAIKTVGNLFGGGSTPAAGNPNGATQSGPLAPGGYNGPLLPANSSNIQSINQQTHITVNGAADANAVGKTVLNGQDRVNNDLTRNGKGNTQ